MAYTILVVDDSNIVRKVFLKTLGLTSIEVNKVLEAENGKKGLELLSSDWVDIVFLDINMPVMGGVEFLERLRQDPVHKETPVVIVSTEGSQERIKHLEELGIKAYLRKPVTPESLAGTIKDVLSTVKPPAN
jgi:two-component system chemotaxis response regulator CheY